MTNLTNNNHHDKINNDHTNGSPYISPTNDFSNKQYSLEICQQPIQCRSCGYGNRERRHIDPPPILQLYEIDENGNRKKSIENPYISHFVVHCDLYDVEAKESKTLLVAPTLKSSNDNDMSENDTNENDMMNRIQILLGTLSINGQELYDLQNEKGAFFIFTDLSVRIEGEFRLQFRLIDLTSFDPFISNTIIKDTIYSNTFRVYSPKTFPGIKESTELSRFFALQRMKIPVRMTSKETKKGENQNDNKGEEHQLHQQDNNSKIKYTRIKISSIIHSTNSPSPSPSSSSSSSSV